MTAPIIPWLGGKRRLADRLIPLLGQGLGHVGLAQAV